MTEQKTVLIVDDHPFFREGLKSLLAKHAEYRLVGEESTGAEGIRKAKELRPDLVIMDITLPDMSGIEATRELSKSLSDTRTVMLSVHLRVDYFTEALRAGAKGYVTKEAATERLFECLDTVLKGDYFMDPLLSRSVAEGLLKSEEPQADVLAEGYSKLTTREQEVLCFVAEGLSTKEIAEKFFISVRTVENHRYKIMNKLGLHSTLELVRYAVRYGLVDTEKWKE